jgi:hypothetical protein
MKKRVYLAGPITKGCLAHNINQATDAFIALCKKGYAPFAPHWSCYSGRANKTAEGHVVAFAGVTPNELTHEDWYGLDLAWVEVSDAVLRLPGESRGADLEVACARGRGIPVFHSVEELLAGLPS